jgi:hypothetical protein
MQEEETILLIRMGFSLVEIDYCCSNQQKRIFMMHAAADYRTKETFNWFHQECAFQFYKIENQN